MYSEPHASYNSLFVTQHHTHDTSYKKLLYSDKRKKKLFFMNIAKEASFHLRTKYKCLCESSQMSLHLENYHHKEACSTFLSVVLIFHCTQDFISIYGVFLLINPKSNNHFKGCRLQQQGFLTVKKINKFFFQIKIIIKVEITIVKEIEK